MNFQSLVLLIGTNPLPNYVIAKYFSDTNTDLLNIFMIHSSGNANQSSTREYAENIEKVLKKNKPDTNLNFKYVSLNDIENQKSNFNDLNSAFDEVSIDENIHLNYTGGTKTMGIHTYNFLKEKYINTFESSYLSAKMFKLINENGELKSDDLRKKVNIELLDLLTLHGFIRANEDRYYNFEKAIKRFEDYINLNNLDFYFKSYSRTYFSSKSGQLIKDKDLLEKKFKGDSSNNKLKEELCISNGLLEINSLLPVNFQLFDEKGKLLQELPKNEFIQTTIEFIDGKWLEEYFLIY
ncbi:MAG: DUF1887 family protein [Ignavibacteria bacterium]|nr:DUF1887 family protein [Ignavibacteria bacterium]